MARIPASEIDRLKLAVSVVRLVEAAGVVLKPHGKDLVGRCPFHDDKTPSLVVSPKSNLWHCLGACQMGGSVVDWVMRFEGVSFRRAIEALRAELGETARVEVAARAVPGTVDAPPASAARAATSIVGDTNVAASARDAAAERALLGRVIDYYHTTLKQSTEALAYLAKRGLDHPELVDHFKLGFANRTLGYRLPSVQSQAGEALKAQLVRLGIYRESGHEHLNGSLIVPVIDAAGHVTEVYGRKIGPRLREGTPLHLYLPGPHRGVFNETGLIGQEEAILTEALLDALTFWSAGYRNVTSSYGVEGFTADMLEAMQRHRIQRVLIAYDADEAGDAAAAKLAPKLMAAGFACYRCRFPQGLDANAYALSVKPAAASLGAVIRQAEWLGEGAPPPRAVPAPSTEPTHEVPVLAAASEAPLDAGDVDDSAAVASASPPLPAPPAYRVPPSAPVLPIEIAASGELTLTLGERGYRMRGIDKNLSYEQLKVWLRVTHGEHFHLDTVDLSQDKQRQAWVKRASVELGVSEEIAKADLGKVLRAVEERQQALIAAQLAPRDKMVAPELSAEQRDSALDFLRAPDLIERIVADFERAGLVGEPTNALVGYLAAVSRKLAHPLAVLIQSTSAAGKSTLMDAVLNFVPEAERVHYSAMTGQSLFYLGDKDVKHKILAIAEEEGVRQAAYALKLLQSQGSLTMASTGKDPVTGKLVTQDYEVEGPVMLFLTTTATDVDEELTNRCLVLTIDESREQTRAILERQRKARTLTGLLADREAERITARHRAAQTLLRPVAVVNPYAERLSFRDDLTRLRRDHQKYLTLIEAIAFLNQHQRPVRTALEDGQAIEYVEVEPADIALANRLAHEVLGRSLDELPPQTRRVLAAIDALVTERAQAQAIERSLVRFTRRELRACAGISDTQLGIHLERLVRFEYLIAHAGRRGQSFVYELVFDGDVSATAPRLPGLIEVGALAAASGAVPTSTTTTQFTGVEAKFSGSKRRQNGAIPAALRAAETPPNARADAVLPLLVAESETTALPRRRANGAASYRSPTRRG